MNIKIKLIQLKKKQVDLLFELRKRKYKIQRSELSEILSGVLRTPKAEEITRAVEDIISDWEKEIKKEVDKHDCVPG